MEKANMTHKPPKYVVKALRSIKKYCDIHGCSKMCPYKDVGMCIFLHTSISWGKWLEERSDI